MKQQGWGSPTGEREIHISHMVLPLELIRNLAPVIWTRWGGVRVVPLFSIHFYGLINGNRVAGGRRRETVPFEAPRFMDPMIVISERACAIDRTVNVDGSIKCGRGEKSLTLATSQ